MPTTRRRHLLVSIGVAVAALGVGCVEAAPTGSPTEPTPSFAVDRGGALTGLPACRAVPPAADGDVPDVPLPDGAVVTQVVPTGEITTLQGYVPTTPVLARAFYAELDGWEVLQSEDEVRESEMLVADGGRRLFVKVAAVCDLGSSFVAVLAPEASSGQVPTPAGTTPTG